LTQVVVAAAAMSLSLVSSSPALAQTKPGCPPGSWFCAEADVNVTPPPAAQPAPQRQQPAAPAVVDDPVEPAEPVQPPPPVVRPRRAPPPMAPPPVVVYQEVPAPPPQVIIVTPGYGGYYRRPVRPVPPPPTAPPKPRWHPEFGLDLRVEGLVMGRSSGAASTAGMGGLGLSLRYRPIPHFAFDLGVDVLAGHDYNGFQRIEVPVGLNGLIYLNPRSRVQFYLMGGAHISRAEVKSDFPARQLSLSADGTEYDAKYTYFGGQGGGGLEFRLSKRFALHLDVLGFVRKRIDDGKVPEFIDYETGRTTNTSGGALIRGGVNFWW
jgi:hypothetical protein